MKTKSEQLRERVEASGRGRMRRYSPRLKDEIVEHVAQERERRVAMTSIAEQLGVALDTLYMWQREARSESTQRFVRLEVAPPSAESIAVHGAAGVRISGLSVAQLAELLLALAA
jgi:transposase-like protein